MALRSPTSSRRRQPKVTRDRLLAAAVDLFAERGYDGVRVRDIAERAGVTTGAIYSHYPDMAALLADAAGRAVDHAVSAVAHVARGEVGKTLLATATSTASGRRLSREQALLLEAFVAARREPTLQRALGEVLRQRLAVVQHAIELGQQDGELRADLSAGAVAWFLYLAPIGLLAGRGVDLPGPNLDAMADVFEAVMTGLAARPTVTDHTGCLEGAAGADGTSDPDREAPAGEAASTDRTTP
jgi:AcrR family transcriptional regulator